MMNEPMYNIGQPVMVDDMPYNINGLSPSKGSWVYEIANSDTVCCDVPQSIINPLRFDLSFEKFKQFCEVVK